MSKSVCSGVIAGMGAVEGGIIGLLAQKLPPYAGHWGCDLPGGCRLPKELI